MHPEIAAAVGFLSSLLRTRGCVSEQRLKVFSGALQEALTGEHRPRDLPPPPTRVVLSHRSSDLPVCSVSLSLLGQSSPRAAPELGSSPVPASPHFWVSSPLRGSVLGLGGWWVWVPLAPRATCSRYRIRMGGEKYPRRERGLLALTEPLDPGGREGAPPEGRGALTGVEAELLNTWSSRGPAGLVGPRRARLGGNQLEVETGRFCVLRCPLAICHLLWCRKPLVLNSGEGGVGRGAS